MQTVANAFPTPEEVKSLQVLEIESSKLVVREGFEFVFHSQIFTGVALLILRSGLHEFEHRKKGFGPSIGKFSSNRVGQGTIGRERVISQPKILLLHFLPSSHTHTLSLLLPTHVLLSFQSYSTTFIQSKMFSKATLLTVAFVDVEEVVERKKRFELTIDILVQWRGFGLE